MLCCYVTCCRWLQPRRPTMPCSVLPKRSAAAGLVLPAAHPILSCYCKPSSSSFPAAYRKLALKLHPDKNKARGADEAFKGATRLWIIN